VGGPAWPDAVKARTRRRGRRRWPGIVSTIITLAIVGGVAYYVWHKNQHHALQVTGVTVAANAGIEPKACAGLVTVIGTIATNGAGGPVTYQWTKTSGTNTTVLPAATVTDGSGQATVPVTLKWTFTGKGTQQDTATLQVLSPTPATGNAQFTYTCNK
jgi:hypothetical protein